MHLKVCNKLEKLTLISARVVEVFALEAIAGCSILTLIKVPLQNFSGFNAQILVDEVINSSNFKVYFLNFFSC